MEDDGNFITAFKIFWHPVYMKYMASLTYSIFCLLSMIKSY